MGRVCFPKDFAGTPLVLGILFVAALQSSTFRKAAGFDYNSTMTPGNLRILGEAMFQTVFDTGGVATFPMARTFGAICLAFLAGAVLGAVYDYFRQSRALDCRCAAAGFVDSAVGGAAKRWLNSCPVRERQHHTLGEFFNQQRHGRIQRQRHRRANRGAIKQRIVRGSR